MFNANADARTDGCVTFARAVFDGPVLKKRKNTAPNSASHVNGNGTCSIRMTNGHASRMPTADTRKYEPGKRGRNLSPAHPPANVAPSPATTTIAPNIVFALPIGRPRTSIRYRGIQ